MSEETDLEATTEESIECVSSSDLEKSKKDEALGNDGKVERVEVVLDHFSVIHTKPRYFLTPLETQEVL